jgi:hypothetical protein
MQLLHPRHELVVRHVERAQTGLGFRLLVVQ